MTTVNGDLVNVLGVKQDGVVRIASSLTRPDGSQVIVDDWDEVYVKAGKFTASVAPGPAKFHVRAGSTSKVFNVVVPKTGTASFASLLEDVVEWSPEVVSRAAMEARAAAASAKEAAKSASDAKAGADRVGTAEQVGKWASSAQSSADNAGRSATAAASSAERAAQDTRVTTAAASAAKADAGKAVSSAKAAGESATAADGSAKAADKSRSDASSFANSAKSASESATSSARQAAGNAETATKAASAVQADANSAKDSATSAKNDADRAKVSADSASTSASGAKSSADAAKGSADSASKSATAAASSASAAKADAGKAATSATNAGKSASAAKADADRAENVIDNVDWHNDRLMVMGKISPPLKGDKGDKGEPGESGASTWDTVTGKPSVFPPEPHKHKMSDITDLPEVTQRSTGWTIARRLVSGQISVGEPSSLDHATTKKYVDDRDAATLAEARALVGSRPAFFSGSGAPPSSIPGAVVGDYYLDETTMELHKITGV